jgi:hypothetical protein
MTIDPSKNMDIDAILERSLQERDQRLDLMGIAGSWLSRDARQRNACGSNTGTPIAPSTVYRTGRSGRSRQPNAYAR